MSLTEVRAAIAAELERVGRPAEALSLIAVSKVQPLERVEAVLQQGHRVFGENRVQEAAGKWPELQERFGKVELHLLGPLQSNKARQAMELFDVIHSVDRAKLARALARLAGELGSCPDLFLQVNTGEEPQKAGVLPADLPALVEECRALGLPVIGLMCIPPVEEEPSLHFALLKKLADRHGLDKLSMGMSGDYISAIAQGATHLRVGSAIFGGREAG
ncbi:YggS family pyridoxal phosphate-dependent enzyme [Poseidonocella sedimentorum]|uniref:Pyridoxal phosphate homeostasis protein n=1 Tax=Poseidonocella sedimentorum TaxID=871652 RepID=A0A1I6ERP9_9RHOB|nr:YggS family pyridoxal phosphate-dependent enzyme [Poseidonocella sedimentorum]SFR20162.1 hypothetical protein SAMN04515673_11919 [Poseidonocella sedimentorum]